MTDVRVLSEPTTYSRDNPTVSFFGDLYRAQLKGDQAARARLEQGTQETLVLAEERGLVYRDAEGRAMSTASTAGGEFLPPIWMGEYYAAFLQARRVVTGLVWNLPLPATGTSVTVPVVGTGDSVAVQTDNTTVTSNDEVTSLLTLPVCSVAGGTDISRQIMERADPGLDQVIAQDLLSSYAGKVDALAITGTGSAGQPQGILNASPNAVTFTSATPTYDLFFSPLAQAYDKVAEAIFEPPTAIVMTARRWAWFLEALSTAKAPIIATYGRAAYDALAEFILSTGTKGPFANFSDRVKPVGELAGIPVYVDENLPKTQGVGTNQDVVLVGQFRKHILWEDAQGPRQFTFSDASLSSTGGVRCQCFGYMAFTAARYPKATSAITGTGLTAPTL